MFPVLSEMGCPSVTWVVVNHCKPIFRCLLYHQCGFCFLFDFVDVKICRFPMCWQLRFHVLLRWVTSLNAWTITLLTVRILNPHLNNTDRTCFDPSTTMTLWQFHYGILNQEVFHWLSTHLQSITINNYNIPRDSETSAAGGHAPGAQACSTQRRLRGPLTNMASDFASKMANKL